MKSVKNFLKEIEMNTNFAKKFLKKKKERRKILIIKLSKRWKNAI